MDLSISKALLSTRFLWMNEVIFFFFPGRIRFGIQMLWQLSLSVLVSPESSVSITNATWSFNGVLVIFEHSESRFLQNSTGSFAWPERCYSWAAAASARQCMRVGMCDGQTTHHFIDCTGCICVFLSLSDSMMWSPPLYCTVIISQKYYYKIHIYSRLRIQMPMHYKCSEGVVKLCFGL